MTTNIEWVSQAGTTPESWNPIVGCSPVSAGCDNCYAARMAQRLAAMGQVDYQGLTVTRSNDERLPRVAFNGQITFRDDHLNKPLRWKKRRTVFLCSMGDLFHHRISDARLVEIHARVYLCSRHTFIVLTKRPARMRRVYNNTRFWRRVQNLAQRIAGDHFLVRSTPLDNLWTMVSVESRNQWEHRVSHLLDTSSMMRGVSLEPLLSPVPTVLFGLDQIDWLIVGMESIGAHAGRKLSFQDRAIEAYIAQCRAAKTACFVKQLHIGTRVSKNPSEWPRKLRVRQWPMIVRKT